MISCMWQPIPDVTVNANEWVHLTGDGQTAIIKLPDDLRLCRCVPTRQLLWTDEYISIAMEDAGITYDDWLVIETLLKAMRDEYESALAQRTK